MLYVVIMRYLPTLMLYVGYNEIPAHLDGVCDYNEITTHLDVVCGYTLR